MQQNSIFIIGAIHVFNLIRKLDSCRIVGEYFCTRHASVKRWIIVRLDLRPDRRDVLVDLILAYIRSRHSLELVSNEQIEPAQLVHWKAAVTFLREERVRRGSERPVVKYCVKYIDDQPVGQEDEGEDRAAASD